MQDELATESRGAALAEGMYVHLLTSSTVKCTEHCTNKVTAHSTGDAGTIVIWSRDIHKYL